MTKPERFTIAIPQSSLEDLRTRLGRFRAAPDFGNDDWRRVEAERNRFEHWRVVIDGVPIHCKEGLLKAGV